VLVIAHIRELVIQITQVYEKLTKYTNIKVSDLVSTGKYDGHVVVTTVGALRKVVGSRAGMDLSGLRIVVIDEVDFFF